MKTEPELSLAVPLFDEEDNVETVAAGLAQAFRDAGIEAELVLVDNGSADRTGELVDALARRDPAFRPLHLLVNQGYGNGILAGLAQCRGRYVGYTWGDSQIRPQDVVAVFLKLRADGLDLCKARRMERHDGVVRRIVSTVYNSAFPLFFRVSTRDVNGCPKILRREVLEALHLNSRDWFLDAEIMIKCERKGLHIGEVPVVFHTREKGASHVRLATVLEFIRNLIRHRIRGTFRC